jgi:hypothetical protein
MFFLFFVVFTPSPLSNHGISLLSTNFASPAGLPNHMMEVVSQDPKRRRSWASYSILSGPYCTFQDNDIFFILAFKTQEV